MHTGAESSAKGAAMIGVISKQVKTSYISCKR